MTWTTASLQFMEVELSDSGGEFLSFPCQYTIKVLGRDTDGFCLLVRQTIEQHVRCERVEQQPSRKGRFVSIRATFTVQSQAQLQQIHQSLHDSGRVSLIL